VGVTVQLLSNVLSSLSIAFNTIEAFGVARVLNGTGAAIMMNCLTLYLQECSPTRVRGINGSTQVRAQMSPACTRAVFHDLHFVHLRLWTGH
jgi:hypothetical protein